MRVPHPRNSNHPITPLNSNHPITLLFVFVHPAPDVTPNTRPKTLTPPTKFTPHDPTPAQVRISTFHI